MRDNVVLYYGDFLNLMHGLRVADRSGRELGFFDGMEMAVSLVLAQANKGNKVMFIGNGASAAMASHMAADFLKNGNIRTVCFNDGALLTCLANDLGYESVFEKPIEVVADDGDILVAISSSGSSENVLRGVEAARAKNCSIMTLSGFSADNPLWAAGDINFYVPSPQYGPVEIAHQFIIHCILDVVLQHKNFGVATGQAV